MTAETTITCTVCNSDFVHEIKRGRQPTKCPACRVRPVSEIREELTLTTLPSVQEVEREYRTQIAELTARYGDTFSIPSSEMATCSEGLRRSWCIAYGKSCGLAENVKESVASVLTITREERMI